MAERQRAKRLPKKLTTRVAQSYGDLDENMETGALRWLRRMLEVYETEYKEVYEPALNDDGSPKLDAFGRPIDMLSAEDRRRLYQGMKVGAVWLTREAIVECFANLFNADRYMEMGEDFEAHYLDNPDEKVSLRNPKSFQTHPAEPRLRKLVEDGLLLRHPDGKTNRYFPSEEACRIVGMSHVWDLHLKRRHRWERAEVTKFRNPAEARWVKVFSYLQNMPVFDYPTVASLLRRFGIEDAKDRGDRRVVDKMKAWRNKGDILEVAPRLYRTTLPGRADSAGNIENGPRTATYRLDDWMYDFMRYQAERQRIEPSATFTPEDVMQFCYDEKDDEWHARNAVPDAFAINRRVWAGSLPGGIKPHEEEKALFVSLGKLTYRIAPRPMAWFDPVPGDTRDTRRLLLDTMYLHGPDPAAPYWFIDEDIAAALDIEIDAAFKLRRRLLEEKLIAVIEYVDPTPIPSPEMPKPLPLKPIYILTPKGFAACGKKIEGEEAQAKLLLYDIPRDPETRFPLRERPAWWMNEDVRAELDARRKQMSYDASKEEIGGEAEEVAG